MGTVTSKEFVVLMGGHLWHLWHLWHLRRLGRLCRRAGGVAGGSGCVEGGSNTERCHASDEGR